MHRRLMVIGAVAVLLGAACASDAPPLDATPPGGPASIAPSVVPASPPPATQATAATKAATPSPPKAAADLRVEVFAVPAGSGPHDVAPARDGGVWYAAQRSGELGWLNPVSGEVKRVPLGTGSAPHGVIVGPDGAAWVTDSGLNAIVRVEEGSLRVTTYPLPASRPRANLNTAAFDGDGCRRGAGAADARAGCASRLE